MEGIAKGKIAMCVNFSYNRVKCWRTGYAGSVMQFVQDYENIDYKVAKELINDFSEGDINLEVRKFSTLERKEVYLPHGFRSLTEGNGMMAVRARKYLERRGFDPEELDAEGFGYGAIRHEDVREDYFGYIIVPFKSQGKLKYFIGRDYIDNEFKYKNPKTEKFGIGKSHILFNEDALDYEKSVYITEGWSDARTLGTLGVATLGWSMSEWQYERIMLSACDDLIFLHDRGFRKETVKAAMKFIGFKNVYVPDLEPIMSENCKDVNDLGKTEEGKNHLTKYVEDSKVLLTRSEAVRILAE